MNNLQQNETHAILVRKLHKQVSNAEHTLDILTGLSLQVMSGERVAIVGSSGSGKSTLLAILAGLDSASSGEVLIHGQNISVMDEDGRAAVRAANMGFVFQSFQLMPSLTALENVMLPLQLRGDSHASVRASAALEKVGLAARLHHYPRQLSGGEQQRVAIARAFAPEPKILLADEPTGNLDVNTAKQIIDLLFALNAAADTTLLLVTHDLKLAGMCQRQLTLRDGQLHEMAEQ